MGYGFLEFETKEQAEKALDVLNGKLLPKANNKTFKLNWAMHKINNSQNPNEFSIYVCELETSVNEEILTNFFKKKYKSVIDSKIILDPSTKISKGYGFVKFSDKTESEKAISEMNGQLLNGKTIKTGTASYKKNEKKNMNIFNDYNIKQNDSNIFMQQQYLNQFYLSNGYINPYYYQMPPQLMNQNFQNNHNMMDFYLGINPDLNIKDENNQNNEMYQQEQDINQFFNDLDLLQKKENNNKDNKEN